MLFFILIFPFELLNHKLLFVSFFRSEEFEWDVWSKKFELSTFFDDAKLVSISNSLLL